ncbi:MAG: TonB-dependent receptor [Melioribacteraceae bacterium]|nr:TonB-dependent receptor [Melioribacteraceae bacterium]MCF8393339.1 TonB-dependent receptor [Melioribacteraceae bacterium]MCF8418904.1 TonB-dependent receptor [Melioribacteraceae bacterium]
MKFTATINFILLMISFTVSAQNRGGSITGKVIDKITKESLPGVNIIVVGTAYGTATDLDGQFSIDDLPVGLYQLKASFIGYDPITKTDVVVNSARPAYVEFQMIESVIELEGVTVTSDFFEMDPTELNSVTNFSYEEIRRAPGGFEDVVRALSILPGVAQQSPGRNDLVVRGGAPSENLYVVDGFVVPNINHFGSQGATGGPLSYINLDFVKETSFSTGGFSSIYGDKLSSVLKIDLRNGRTDQFGGKALVSATQFGLNLEGPVSEKGSFLFSIRRSYLDFIFDAAGFNFVPEYYDLITKWNYNLSTSDRLSFLFVGAYDRVKFNNKNTEDIYDNARILGNDQNQYLAGLSYRHLFKNGFSTLSFSRNYVKYDFIQKDTLLNPVFINKSIEAENELKADLVYKLSSTSEINAGFSGKLINFETDVRFPPFVTTFGEVLTVNSLSAKKDYYKGAFYTQYSDVLFNRLRITLGGRADYFSGIEKSFYFSPRFLTSFMINEISNISFSTGIYYQNPSYIWLSGNPQNNNLTAVRVDQFVLGYEHMLRSDIRVKIEGFYKDYKDYPTSTLRPYLVLANTGAGYAGADNNFQSFGLEPLVSSGSGYSRGLEFSMQKKSSEIPHYGFFSLTYSETYFTALDGVERAGSYDQRWIMNLSAGYIFNQKWEASIKFRLATGFPYTPYNSNGTQSISDFNTERFPVNHSLDIRFDRRWDFEGWALITYLDIQNIYNRQNVNQNRWDYQKMKVRDESSIGILPSIGVSLEW